MSLRHEQHVLGEALRRIADAMEADETGTEVIGERSFGWSVTAMGVLMRLGFTAYAIRLGWWVIDRLRFETGGDRLTIEEYVARMEGAA